MALAFKEIEDSQVAHKIVRDGLQATITRAIKRSSKPMKGILAHHHSYFLRTRALELATRALDFAENLIILKF